MLVASRAKAGGDQGNRGPRSRSKPIFAGVSSKRSAPQASKFPQKCPTLKILVPGE